MGTLLQKLKENHINHFFPTSFGDETMVWRSYLHYEAKHIDVDNSRTG